MFPVPVQLNGVFKPTRKKQEHLGRNSALFVDDPSGIPYPDPIPGSMIVFFC